jgi:hypothetical protein
MVDGVMTGVCEREEAKTEARGRSHPFTTTLLDLSEAFILHSLLGHGRANPLLQYLPFFFFHP